MGRSIVGRGAVIRQKRAQAKKSRATGAYRARNEALPFVGYASYSEYLKSPEWKKIRQKVLRRHPVCACCDRPASQVHHYCYDEAVLLGLNNELLFPVCDGCHEKVEFIAGEKLSLEASQNVLEGLLSLLHQKRLYNGKIKAATQSATLKRNERDRRRSEPRTGDSRHPKLPPPDPGYLRLTEKRLKAGMVGTYQFSEAQLAMLQVAKPLKKGWFDRLIGSQMRVRDYQTFLALKGA